MTPHEERELWRAMAELRRERDAARGLVDKSLVDLATEENMHDHAKGYLEKALADNAALRKHSTEWIAALRSLSPSDPRRLALLFDAAKNLEGMLDGEKSSESPAAKGKKE